MTNLFDATLAVVRELGVARQGTATSGSTTTLIDTGRSEVDDAFNGGTVWIISDAGGASAAPEGEWATISDWVNSTGTATISTLTASVGDGDVYVIATARYPLDVLISAINSELIKYWVPRWDKTSLDVIADQSEYTLPSGIHKYNLINVYETTTSDSNENRPVHLSYEVHTADAGSQHTLEIKSRNITSGNNIWLEYLSHPTPISAATDTIDEAIRLPNLVAHAAARAILISMQTYGSANDMDKDLRKELKEEAEKLDRRYPQRIPSKRGNVNEAAAS
jgi:hypothetical protein